MRKCLVSTIESSSFQHGKNKSSIVSAKEVKKIQEKVNINFGDFKSIKWLNVRNASKEHRKGTQ